MNIKVVVADDHAIVRHGLIRLIQSEDDIEVVGQAENGLAVLQVVREYQPDVVVMDISMPQLNGIEATRQITSEMPNVKVIALSMHSAKRFIIEMFRAGAYGYLLKDCASNELAEAIHVVSDGKKYVSPAISDIVVENYVLENNQFEYSASSILTQREREVLQLLSEGKTTKQIALSLFISPKTVEAHRLRVMGKLHIDSVARLTKYAIQEGLTLLES
ncbi:MAG: response regulator transcription factor [Phycisphaerae bacterium]|nr:response regulator transcription factor [Phycisphaerae bacterium]